MICSRVRYGLLKAWIALALLMLLPAAAQAQFGGFGGGGLGGGGLGGGGLGGGLGGGGGGFGANLQGAGVVVDAGGVLQLKTFREVNGQVSATRFAAAKAKLHADIMAPSDLRMVSLNRLEAAIARRLANNEGITDDMRYLAGMLRIQYVFFYPETNDIVIAGPAEGFAHDPAGRVRGLISGRSILELQDLIVALRAFPPSGQQTRVIGVSIDPTQEGLQRMQQQYGRMVGRVTPGDAGNIAAALRQALGPQKITFQGVSPKTHFAQVLVEADYRMKLIGIGLEHAPKETKIESYVSKASGRSLARNALLRWYFTPNYECVRVSEDELAMELDGWGVKLIGADELVQGDGARVDAGRVDALNRAYCKTFTDNYGRLADYRPVFAQLRNVIDMSVVAAYIQQMDYYGRAGWNMELFGDEERVSVETYDAPTTVASAVNVVWKGNRLITPIGGGVSIQPRRTLEPQYLLEDEGAKVQQKRQEISFEGLEDGQWWWDHARVDLEKLKNSKRTNRRAR